MTDISSHPLSVTAVSAAGTLRWMSPELLDPPRFGSDGRPTRGSDCYALGMVIYEVSRLYLVDAVTSVLLVSGPHGALSIPSIAWLYTRLRCAGRQTSEEASRSGISRSLPGTLGFGAIMLE